MATYAYTRVSTGRQAETGESLEVQRRRLEGYAQQQDMELARLYVERGVSGAKPLAERPEGQRMLKALRPGDVVVSMKLDRVFRSALDALQTCDAFRRRRVSLHLLDLGGDVTGDGIAGLFMKIAAAFAEFERDRVAERVRDVKRDQLARGRYLGGKVPFGHRVVDGDLVEVPEEQAVIGTVLELRAGGLALRKVAAEVEARHGVRLAPMTVRRICADGESPLSRSSAPSSSPCDTSPRRSIV